MTHRSLKLILVGLLCLALGAGGLWLAWRAVHDVTRVWVTTHAISSGQVIGDGDVTSAEVVLGQGARSVPVTQPVVGRLAVVDIPAGAILTPDEMGWVSPDQAGQVRLSVVVTVGSAPVTELAVGGPVTLLGPSGDPVHGAVVTVPRLVDASHQAFDVTVKLDDALRLAQWVAQGEVVVATP